MKVTIGVCVRNCASDVSEIIKILTNQDFPHNNMEIIFVDDGSEDNTLSLILKHVSSLNISYKVFSHQWRGLGYSRNVVLKNAQGDYIVWVDDGTIISKDYVKKHVDFMDQHPNVGIAKGIIDLYNGPNGVAALENMVALTYYHNCVGKSTKKLPGTGGSVYRVTAARQVGGFDERINGATEDMDIAQRISSAGWLIFITEIKFSKVYNGKLKKVWNKNFWYGYGSHFTLNKHRNLKPILYKSTPLAGFIEGLLIYSDAYKLTRRKIAYFLPFFLSFKRTAFCLGFIKSHFDSYKG